MRILGPMLQPWLRGHGVYINNLSSSWKNTAVKTPGFSGHWFSFLLPMAQEAVFHELPSSKCFVCTALVCALKGLTAIPSPHLSTALDKLTTELILETGNSFWTCLVKWYKTRVRNSYYTPYYIAYDWYLFCLFSLFSNVCFWSLVLFVACLKPLGFSDQRSYKLCLAGSYDASYAMGAIESARMDYGLSTVDGDGTVPLLSLGYMCKGAWREFQEMNPGLGLPWGLMDFCSHTFIH